MFLKCQRTTANPSGADCIYYCKGVGVGVGVGVSVGVGVGVGVLLKGRRSYHYCYEFNTNSDEALPATAPSLAIVAGERPKHT